MRQVLVEYNLSSLSVESDVNFFVCSWNREKKKEKIQKYWHFNFEKSILNAWEYSFFFLGRKLIIISNSSALFEKYFSSKDWLFNLILSRNSNFLFIHFFFLVQVAEKTDKPLQFKINYFVFFFFFFFFWLAKMFLCFFFFNF